MIIDSFAVTLVDIGVLIGLYLAPGVVLNIPGGILAARVVVLISVLVCLMVYLIICHPPPDAEAGATQLEFVKFPVYALLLAGTIWAFFNVALAMIFSFCLTS